MTTTRKFIALFILALLPAVTMMAQSIEGKWNLSEESKKVLNLEDDEAKGSLLFTFSGTSVEMAVQFDFSDDEVGTLGFEVTVPGTYKIEESTLKNNFNHAESSAQIYKLDFSKEVKAAMEASDEVKSMLITAITQEFDKNKGQMMTGVRMIAEGLSTLKIIDSSDATLTIEYNDNDKLVFNKVE